MRTGTPPARSVSPLSMNSAARSSRIGARPRAPATEPSVPISTPPAAIEAPLAGSGESATTGTMRRRAVPRFCMRDTTSCPT